MPKPPLEPSKYLTLQEAYRLLSVSRTRFYQWQTAGLISANWHNGSHPRYLRTDVLALPDRLPRGPKLIGPLLPPEDRTLAKERAGEPDFAGVFTECFERVVPSMGEGEARTRALAHTIRAYRRHHDCDYKSASAVVRALIGPKEPVHEFEIEPSLAATAPSQEPQSDRPAEAEQSSAPFSDLETEPEAPVNGQQSDMEPAGGLWVRE
jgi:hypothetical protein